MSAISVTGSSVASSRHSRSRRSPRHRTSPPGSPASFLHGYGALRSPSATSQDPMLFDCGTGVVWTLTKVREVLQEKLRQHTSNRSQFRQAITHVFKGQDTVNAASFRKAFRDLGIRLSRRDADRLFHQFDTSGDGVIGAREFLNAVFGRDFRTGWEIGAEAIPAKKFDPNPPVGTANPTRRYSVDRIERLYRLKLEQCYKEGSGQLMHMVGKMYGPNARAMNPDAFVRATYSWLAIKLTDEQLAGLLERTQARSRHGGVNVYKMVSCLIRGPPKHLEPVAGFEQMPTMGQHHKVALPAYQSVAELEDVIRHKANQYVKSTRNPAAKLLQLFRNVHSSDDLVASPAEMRRVLNVLGIQLRDADLAALLQRQRMRQRERRTSGSTASVATSQASRRYRRQAAKPKEGADKPPTPSKGRKAAKFTCDTPLNWLPGQADVNTWRSELRLHRQVTSRVVSPGHAMLSTRRRSSTTSSAASSSRASAPGAARSGPQRPPSASTTVSMAPSLPPFSLDAAEVHHARDGRRVASRALRIARQPLPTAARGRSRASQATSGTVGRAATSTPGDGNIDFYAFVNDVVGPPGWSKEKLARRSSSGQRESGTGGQHVELTPDAIARALLVARTAAAALTKRGGPSAASGRSTSAAVPVPRPPSTSSSTSSRRRSGHPRRGGRRVTIAGLDLSSVAEEETPPSRSGSQSARRPPAGPVSSLTPKSAAATARTLAQAIQVLAQARRSGAISRGSLTART